ncbi:MAG: acyl-CoA desaturase [Pseudomonadales bacterium]|nr:acyl-CoA desaturase [Pseudomonadales bacterium]
MTALPSTGIQKSESLRIIKIRIVLFHLLCLGVFFVPVTPELVFWTVVTFFIRVFAWEAGSHRYFAHRSFKTSRAFQLFLAVLAASGGQRGPIWWAEHHRHHHRHSDQPEDPHSPVHKGYWFAHFGWLIDPRYIDTNLDNVKDLAKYPELVWVNKYHYLFPYVLLIATYVIGEYTAVFGREGLGVSALFWVFILSTVLSVQSTFSVNTLTHGHQSGFFNHRRFNTGDATTNNWFMCIPTMGASWHNNHHRYMNAARAGFYWWQLDLTYLVLKLLSWFGIVWDLHKVPDKVLEEGRKPRSTESTAVGTEQA